MKKNIWILLLAACLLMMSACGDQIGETTTEATNAEMTLQEHDCTTTQTQLTTPEPLDYEVSFVAAGGEVITPHEELIYGQSYHIYSDGAVAPLVYDGYLMLMSTKSCLPIFAEKIPEVTLDEYSHLVATAREGVAIRGGEKADVHGEDYEKIGEKMTIAEILEKGKNEWSGKTVYLYFSFSFADETSADYTVSEVNGYFVKTVLG